MLVKVVSEKCLTGGQFVYRLTKIILEYNHDVSESVRDIDTFNIRTFLYKNKQLLIIMDWSVWSGLSFKFQLVTIIFWSS